MIYETHVKGFTMRHRAVPARTCAAPTPGSPPSRRSPTCAQLGVTAVELLPVHHIADETFLIERGLSNYWGYSSIGYLAPHGGYAATGAHGEQLHEFKGMVKALHRAGIEVILDVVYNHTAEGNHLGPMLSFRGVDNAAYYRLMPGDPRYYMDFTGTGNSLNPVQPTVLRLIMDSLRYWVIECHVDGFRFDLAAALAREFYDVDRLSAFFDIIHQDPVLSQVKLIAEPWDVGPGGYQVGNFPVLWSEWNGDVPRHDARLLARRAPAWPSSPRASPAPATSTRQTAAGRSPRSTSSPPTTASRCATSSPTTTSTTRPTARTTATAPTTTARGTAASRARPTIPRSSRCARASSATSSPRCCSRRACRCCSAATSSAARQEGNNNAWCQDNEISWYDWEHQEWQRRLLEFTRRLIELRREHPVFRRTNFLAGQQQEGSGLPDAWWFRADGRRMTQRDWANRVSGTLGVFLNGDEITETTREGEPIIDDCFLLLFNAHFEDVEMRLPNPSFGREWALELSTLDPDLAPGSATFHARDSLTVTARSLILLKRSRPGRREP